MSTDYLFTKKYTCPCCSNSFKTYKVRQNKVHVLKRCFDTGLIYDNEANPYLYFVNICPHCKYAFSDNSSKIPFHRQEALEKEVLVQLPVVANFSEKRSLEDAKKSYIFAIVISDFLKEHKAITAGLCLRLAWLYRHENNNALEKSFLDKSLKLFEEYYYDSTPNDDIIDYYNLSLIMSKLYLQSNQIDKAKKFLNALIFDAESPLKFKKIAKDDWESYKYKKPDSL